MSVCLSVCLSVLHNHWFNNYEAHSMGVVCELKFEAMMWHVACGMWHKLCNGLIICHSPSQLSLVEMNTLLLLFYSLIIFYDSCMNRKFLMKAL